MKPTDRLNKNVRIVREGEELGEFPRTEVPSLLETGFLRDSDVFMDEVKGDLRPVSELIKERVAFTPKVGVQQDDAPAEVAPIRPYLLPIASGWIAFVFALAMAIGMWVWNQNSNEILEKQSAQIAQLRTQLAESQNAYNKAVLTSREIVPEGMVRGTMSTRDAAGKRKALSNIELQLFSRATIDAHLAAREQSLVKPADGAPMNDTELSIHYLTGLPVPLATTVTGEKGRYEFTLPEEGEYIIATVVSLESANGKQQRIWLVAFDSKDDINSPVDLSDTNLVLHFQPGLMISQGR